MGEPFAFLLPITFATFGGAFLIVWRWGAKAALPWGLGYLTAATAFSMPIWPKALDGPWLALLADTLFTFGFFWFSHAMLLRIGRPTLVPARLAVCAVSIALFAWTIFGDPWLRAEFALSDFSCATLLAFGMVGMRGHLRRPADRALFAAAALVMLDTVGRGSTVFLTAPEVPGSFLGSDYAFLMQIAATIFGVIFALAGLAAMAVDVVESYRTEAQTDPLSGLLNRRGFDHAVSATRHGGAREGSIVSCDIDHFKRINDRFGHAAGDRVIAAFAAIIRAHLPVGGVAARFGGEEFVAWLPARGTTDATRFANSVRTAFADHDWADAGIDGPLTASFGLSGVSAGEASLDAAIAHADEGLYEAKKAGRNRVGVKLALVPGEGRPPTRTSAASRQSAGPISG